MPVERLLLGRPPVWLVRVGETVSEARCGFFFGDAFFDSDSFIQSKQNKTEIRSFPIRRASRRSCLSLIILTHIMNPSSENELVKHLDWSAKQSRILTANGRAEEYYKEFEESDLPHYHVLQGNCLEAFRHFEPNHLVLGAYRRTLFYGGFEHSTDEDCWNLQTPSFFIDLRIPHYARRELKHISSLPECTPLQLRLLARQHVFSGCTRVVPENACQRHHCIDWNFVGKPRNRPNQWRVEFFNENQWKEWAWATDHQGQYYYAEHWERIENNKDQDYTVLLCLQKDKTIRGVIVICGDLFNYIINKRPIATTKFASLVDLVDNAVENGDLTTAREWLQIEAGHGKNWQIEASLQPWKVGTTLDWQNSEKEKFHTCLGEEWQVFASNHHDIDQLLLSTKRQRTG